MYLIIKEKVVNGEVVRAWAFTVCTKIKAIEAVKSIREKDQNQLCYYEEIKNA